jgi:cytochrome c biogenesis protein CcdA
MARVIRTITEGLTPIAPLRPVRLRTWTWDALSLLGLVTVTGIIGLRRDLSAAAFGSTLVPQMLAMGVLAGVAAPAALRLALPGADRQSDRIWALGVLALWPCALFVWDLVEGETVVSLAGEPLHLACMRTIGTIALTPAIAMTVMIRRGATLRPYWAAAMAGAAAAGVGAVGVALTCPISRVSHVLIAHALPTVAVAGMVWAAISWSVRRPVSRMLGTVALVAVMFVVPARGTAAGTGTEQLAPFRVAASTGGYVSSGAFLEFLQTADRGAPQTHPFDGQGPLLIGAAILLGGVLLNLTPCVLPMIPINLAIIGAGRTASSRRRGWLLGGAYGAAMAVVYGLLGGIIVATAGTFGVLNASSWFNAAIAVLFLVLGLAMFDVLTVDLSRWSGRIRVGEKSRGNVAVAFFMGGVAALLAGACVAPVVIQVVALSSRLYSGGSRLALALPLILGVGMGLPWPFAGAGLAALPKPGAWMVRVKQGLGVCILVTAAYYGSEAFTLARPHDADRTTAADGWHQSLDEGLSAARREGKPVFLDVWATWCKNCAVMDATTFRDPKVRDALAGYVKVRFQADDLERPDVSALLDRLDSVGLPTYAVLQPTPQN